uniref:Oxidation resistance protein 1 n=1 Tax=Tetraodon nigroviridis TaxID=99883 RepID=H3C0C8_TETNG
SRDTLNSIALKFDTTPNKLVQLNKLFSRAVVPGQVLYVPDPEYVSSVGSSPSLSPVSPLSPSCSEAELEKVTAAELTCKSPTLRQSRVVSSTSEEEEALTEKFLKINCKYITDGKGAVSGVLLITPNNIMFDPHRMDPMVQAHGCEEYGIMCPLEEVQSAAIYKEITDPKIRETVPDLFQTRSYCVHTEGSVSEDVFTEPELSPIREEEQVEADAKAPGGAGVSASQAEEPAVTKPEDYPPDTATENQSQSPMESKQHSEREPPSTPTNTSSTSQAQDASSSTSRPGSQSSATPDATGTTLVSVSPKEEANELPDVPKTDPMQQDEEERENKEKMPTEGLENSAEGKRACSCCAVIFLADLVRLYGALCRPLISAQVVWPTPPGDKVKPRNHGSIHPPIHYVAACSFFLPLSDNSSSLSQSGLRKPRFSPKQLLSQTADTALIHGGLGSAAHYAAHVSKAPTSSISSSFKTRPHKYRTSAPLILKPSHWDCHVHMLSLSSHQGKESQIHYYLLLREKSTSCAEKKQPRTHKFLCLRVGKPMKKTFVSNASASMQQYAQQGKKHEYWFAVPQERSDHLYVFFMQWSPDMYGEGIRGMDQEPGFMVVKKNEVSESAEDEPITDLNVKEWEITTKEEVNSKHGTSIKAELEAETFKPNLREPSDLLEAHQIEKLAKNLPPRTIGYPWTLAFGTSKHGMSIKTLYRAMQGQDTPVLMVIKDSDGQVFGALASEPFKVSEGFYGTGETFLFTFNPEFEVYRWTGDNMFFIKGDMDSLAFGGGSGEFGLWLDGDLYHGRSHSCKTFGNPMLSKKEDFFVQDIEIWTFE